MDNSGGFNKYAATPKGSQADTPSRASRNASTLRPVTIKQVLESTQAHPDAEFRIDDVELGHISFIGKVTNITEQATIATLALNDGTGLIEVRTFFAPDNGPSKVPVGEWARIIGSLKSFGGKRHVNAHQVQAIHDLNEINYHLLEATAVHLYFTRGPPEQFTQAAGGTVAPGGDQQVYGYGDPMTGVDGGTGYAGQPAGYGGQPASYSGQPAGYGGQPSGYGGQPAAYGAPGAGFGGDGAAYRGEGVMYDEEGVLYDAGGGGVALEAARQGTGLGGEPGAYQGGGDVYHDAGATFEDDYGGGMYSDDTRYSAIAKRILDCLRADGVGVDGLHLNSLAQMCGLSIQDTEKGTSELLFAGAIFTTLDDSHFALIR